MTYKIRKSITTGRALTFIGLLFCLTSFQLFSEEFPECTSDALRRSGCVGVIVVGKNEGTFRGVIRNHRPSGYGQLVWSSGLQLEGVFRDGGVEGIATLKDVDGSIVYSGTFSADGSPSGRGVRYFPDGSRFEGEIRNLQPNGFGILTTLNGDKFSGVYRDSALEGNGKVSFLWADGSSFDGYLADGEKSGFGKEILSGGGRYFGEFRNGEHSGFGSKTFIGGGRYIGEFQNGKPHGWGAYVFAAQDLAWVGAFERGDFIGEGVVVSNDKVIFEGSFSPKKLLREHRLSERAEKFVYKKHSEDRIRSACEEAGITLLSDEFDNCSFSLKNSYPSLSRTLVRPLERFSREVAIPSERELSKRQKNLDFALELVRLGSILMGGSASLGGLGVDDEAIPSKSVATTYTTVRLPSGKQMYCTQIGGYISCR